MGQCSRLLIKETPCTQQKGTPGLTSICCLLQSAFTRANITCEMYLLILNRKPPAILSYEMVGFSYITWVFVYSETDMLCILTTEMTKKNSILKVENTVQSTRIRRGLFRFYVNSNKFTINRELTLHEHFKVVIISIPQLKLSFVKLNSRVFPS